MTQSAQHKNLLRILKQEYLTNGGAPDGLEIGENCHQNLMSKSGLSETAYREFVTRLESAGIVKAVALQAWNGHLKISPAIVRVVDEIDRIEREKSPMYLEGLLESEGEDFQVTRKGKLIATVRGLRNEDPKEYIGFLPGFRLEVGDLLVGIISHDQYRVLDVRSDMMNGEVFQIKAYYETEGAYQRRAASQPSSIVVQNMTNSAIQHNSHGSTQIVSIRQVNKSDAAVVVGAIRAALDTLEINPSIKDDIVADLETAEAQLKKAEPKAGLINSALESVQSGLKKGLEAGASAATVAAGNGLLQLIGQYLAGG